MKKLLFLFTCIALICSVQAQNSLSKAEIYLPNNADSIKVPVTVMVGNTATLRNVYAIDFVKDRVKNAVFLDSMASIRDAMALIQGGGGGGEIQLTNYYTKSETESKFPLVTSTYTDPAWLTLTKSKVGLGNVQNVDQTNPANITQSSTYRFTTDAEKATWNAKQAALGFTPVANTFAINGVTLSGSSITLSKANFTDLNLVDNTSDAQKWTAIATITNKTISGASNTFSNIPQSAINSLSSDLAARVIANAAITPGTYTKITYDAKGLVNSGGTLIESDIPSLSISKVNGLQTALDALQPAGLYATSIQLSDLDNRKVNAVDGYGLSKNSYEDADKNKLQNIQNGATANQTDAYLLSFANHTDKITANQIDPNYIQDFDPEVAKNESIALLKYYNSPIRKQPVGVDLFWTTGNTALSAVDNTCIFLPLVYSEADTITHIYFDVLTAGATVVLDNENKLGLYTYNSSTGVLNLVATSASLTATDYQTAGLKALPITTVIGSASTYYVPGPSLYFIGYVYNQASAATAPVARAASRSGTAQTGGTSSKMFFRTVSANTLPTSVTISSASVSGLAPWVATGKQ